MLLALTVITSPVSMFLKRQSHMISYQGSIEAEDRVAWGTHPTLAAARVTFLISTSTKSPSLIESTSRRSLGIAIPAQSLNLSRKLNAQIGLQISE